MKRILIFVLLISSQIVLVLSQSTDCSKAEKLFEKAIDEKLNRVNYGLLHKVIKKCPLHFESNLLLGNRAFNATDRISYRKSIEYYSNALLEDPKNTEILKQRSLVYLCLGEINKARADYLQFIEWDEDALFDNIQVYVDTLLTLGESYFELHKKRNLKPRDLLTPTGVEKLFRSDPLLKGMPVGSFGYSNALVKELLLYRMGLRKSISQLKINHPLNPHVNWYYAEHQKEETDLFYSHSYHPYPHLRLDGNTEYERCLEYYQKVLDSFPNHLPTLIRIADIKYINKDFGEAIPYYDRIISVSASHQIGSTREMEALRMKTKIEWLLTLDYQAISKNVLYHDQGRYQEWLHDIGAIASLAGYMMAGSKANMNYYYAGMAVDLSATIIARARLDISWFDKLWVSGQYQKLYDKSRTHLVRHINNNGFYSEESMLLILGVIYAQAKEPSINNPDHFRFIKVFLDNYTVYRGNSKELLQGAAIAYGSTLLSQDPTLSPLESLKYANLILSLSDQWYQEKGEYMQGGAFRQIALAKKDLVKKALIKKYLIDNKSN